MLYLLCGSRMCMCCMCCVGCNVQCAFRRVHFDRMFTFMKLSTTVTTNVTAKKNKFQKVIACVIFMVESISEPKNVPGYNFSP